MTDTVTTRDDRHVLRLERRFPHPRAAVWDAITEPGKLSLWWPLSIDELPQEEGAPLRFHEESLESTGEVTVVRPGEEFGFVDDDGAHEVRFDLSDEADGDCRLVFTHTFSQDEAPAQHATGWHFCFEALAALLDGREIPPLGYDPELRKRYEEMLSP